MSTNKPNKRKTNSVSTQTNDSNLIERDESAALNIHMSEWSKEEGIKYRESLAKATRNAEVLAGINAPWYKKAYDATIDRFKSIGKGIVYGAVFGLKFVGYFLAEVIAKIKSIVHRDSNVEKPVEKPVEKSFGIEEFSLTNPVKGKDQLVQEKTISFVDEFDADSVDIANQDKLSPDF